MEGKNVDMVVNRLASCVYHGVYMTNMYTSHHVLLPSPRVCHADAVLCPPGVFMDHAEIFFIFAKKNMRFEAMYEK